MLIRFKTLILYQIVGILHNRVKKNQNKNVYMF